MWPAGRWAPTERTETVACFVCGRPRTSWVQRYQGKNVDVCSLECRREVRRAQGNRRPILRPVGAENASTTPGPNRLSDDEYSRLQHHEETIRQGMRTFLEVGSALLGIKEQRLYRAEFPTFEEYVSTRWNMAKSRAYQLIDASETAENIGLPSLKMSTIVDESSAPPPPPEVRESQLRPLSGLEPEEQREAWRDATKSADGKTPTAKQVKASVAKVKAKAAPPEPKSKPITPPVTDEDEELFNAIWSDISPRIREAIRECPEGRRDMLARAIAGLVAEF